MTPDALRTGFRDLGTKLYSQELTDRRRARFDETCRESAHLWEELRG